MNEFDWEVLQKKRIAQSAKYKKNGVKSKKCSLPSDGMTQKQWKERNGEVVSYNPSKPMSWEQFKSLPKDVQQQYIERLQAQYGVATNRIAGMFGVVDQTLYNYFRKNGIAAQKKRKWSKEQHIKWHHFLDGEYDVSSCETAADIEEVSEVTSVEAAPAVEEVAADQMPVENIPVEPEKKPQRKPAFTLDNFQLQFSGEFDPDAIRNSLAMILARGQRVRIEIRCEAEGD